MRLPAIILAGGLSSRMGGGDKPLRELDGRPILSHVVERLSRQCEPIAINANGDPERFAGFGVPVIADLSDDFPGPLGGVQAGMRWAADSGFASILTVAGDTPFFPDDLAQRLTSSAGIDVIAVASSAARQHPTFALWPTFLAGRLAAYLDEGGRRVTGFIEQHPHVFVDFPEAQLPGGAVDPFFNINTPDDLAQAQRLVKTSAG